MFCSVVSIEILMVGLDNGVSTQYDLTQVSGVY